MNYAGFQAGGAGKAKKRETCAVSLFFVHTGTPRKMTAEPAGARRASREDAFPTRFEGGRMINYFFVWFCVFLMMLTGIIVCKMMRVNEEFLNRKGVLIIPAIGMIFLMNTVQILNLWMPVSWLCWPYLFFLFLGALRYRASVFRYFKAFVGGRRFLGITALILLVWMLPFLNRTELVSIQVWNNDIIYYLASMEWLKEHPSLAEVVYDSTHPLYWCAEYMLNRTRTGFDGYGALMMSLFGLRAHEIFSCMGMVFGMTALFHVYYLFSVLYQVPWKIRAAVVILIALAGRAEELLIYQYVPQMLGISLLLLFAALTVPFFTETGKVRHGLPALVLSGIITVYAEFCAYLVVFYLGIAILAYRKGKKDALRKGWLEGVAAILLNPAGTYRAIKINLFILMNAGGSMENIDPFHGETISLADAAAQLIGACRLSSFEGKIHEVYLIVLLLSLMGILFLWVYYLWKVPDERKGCCVLFAAFWLLYELYFRIIKYSYGEYKHLMSGTALLLVLTVYAGYQSVKGFRKKRIVQAIYAMLGIFLFFCGIYKIKEHLLDKEFYYYDHTLMELEEAAKLVPATEAIGMGGTPASIHGMVYALKDSPAMILSNYTSYFPYSEESSGRYQLYEGNYRTHESSRNERFLWGNGRFYLLENTSLQAAFYTGFHLPEIRDETEWHDICDREASILIYNFSDETKCFSAAFQTAQMADSFGGIRLVVNGQDVAAGSVGDYFVTDMLMLDAGEKMRIYIYYDGELSEWEGKTVGFSIKDFKLVTYAEK